LRSSLPNPGLRIDLTGFRISNLGTPTAAGDATKTDNATVPHPSSGTGSAGTSLLAAPADHVHPATEGGPQLLSVAGAAFVPLTVPALIKITAANDNAGASCRIRSKTVTLRAA
jgi:hypothetical protein